MRVPRVPDVSTGAGRLAEGGDVPGGTAVLAGMPEPSLRALVVVADNKR